MDPQTALRRVRRNIAAFFAQAIALQKSLSRYVPTWAYEFNDPNAPQRFLPPVSFPYGA